MAVPKANNAQRDFSGGEADSWMKRGDDMPQHKSVARQMSNWRPLQSRGLSNRPGRRILALEGSRVDEVVMSPGNFFYLAFGNGYLRVYNATFAKVFDSGNVMPWTTATAKTVVWDFYRLSVYICFDGMQPRILTWDGVSQSSTWTLSTYAETVMSNGQKRTVFYRLSPLGITCVPTAPVGGNVNQIAIDNPGTFTQVPTVTIIAPPLGGTTATATATINVRSVTIVDQGVCLNDTSPLGALVRLPNNVVLTITGVLFTPGGGPGTIGLSKITSVAISSPGSIASGSAPSNPVTATSVDGFPFAVAPTFNLVWQIATLTLTNGGGTGYLTAPTVSFTPAGGAAAHTTISDIGPQSTTITFSGGMALTSSYIGTRIRYANRQILITGVTTATTATGIFEEQVFGADTLSTTLNQDLRLSFSIGQEVIGQTSGAKAIVIQFSGGGAAVQFQYLTGTKFSVPETIVGPSGSALINQSSALNQVPQAVTVWDEEVMNSFRGWPRSVSVDQSRLIFSDFPALPQLIVWSAVGDFSDLYTDDFNAGPTNAIQELAPGKSRVLYIVPGAEGSEFVFCDNAVYYIPINQTTPLRPGSVAFNTLLSEGSAQVKPRPVQQSIVFISAGLTQVKAVQAIGAYSRPYIVDDISELHSHLLHTPIAIAAPGGSDQFEESYFYICNADGSLILCNFDIANGVIDKKTLGWLPWTGGGTATWVSALKGHSDVLVTGTYAPNGITAVAVVEQVDAAQYLDAAMLYNTAPASLAPPGGKGPLWWIPGGTVDLMDGLRMMGTYQIDANGFLVPQNNAGENFTSATLSVGQAWTATLSRSCRPCSPARTCSSACASAASRALKSTCRIRPALRCAGSRARRRSAPIPRPAPSCSAAASRRGTRTTIRRVAPPLREQAYSERPIGRFHDPRVAIIKDTPGPLTILELNLEVSV
jgi:hypothetical protein